MSTFPNTQPKLKVIVRSYPESNGKRNWTAIILREDPWGGLIGTGGGVVIACGENWNRVAYAAERAKYLLALRDDEPWILDYGTDIPTPDLWKGEKGRPERKKREDVEPLHFSNNLTET